MSMEDLFKTLSQVLLVINNNNRKSVYMLTNLYFVIKYLKYIIFYFLFTILIVYFASKILI